MSSVLDIIWLKLIIPQWEMSSILDIIWLKLIIPEWNTVKPVSRGHDLWNKEKVD
jgi:hypothetical protein